MIRVITFLALLIIQFVVNAQISDEEKAIKRTIHTFFNGLHKGDSTMVGTTLHPSITIQTTYTSKQGKKILINETKEKILTSIANKKPENTYYEKLISWNIEIDGNLASVWTPYEFYLNGNLSHCGANSFQLFNDNGSWKVIYLADMRRKESCDTLKDKR